MRSYISHSLFSLIILTLLLSYWVNPIISAVFYVLLFNVFVSKKHRLISIFTFSLFMATLSLYTDISGRNIGDITTYYTQYYSENFSLYALSEFKVYRASMFFLLRTLGVEAQIYSFISIFVSYFLTILTTFLFLRKMHINVCRKVYFVCILLVMSCFSIQVVYGFETHLAFAIFFLSLYFLFSDKKLFFIFLSLLSSIVHIAILPLAMLALLSTLIKVKKEIYFSVAFFVVLFLLWLSRVDIDFGNLYLHLFITKFQFYMNGPWVKYIGISEYIMFVISLLKIVVLFYACLYIRSDNVFCSKMIRFTFFMLPLFIFFLSSRTLALRYVYIGGVICIPLIFFVMSKVKRDSCNGIIVCCFLVAISIFPYNLRGAYYFPQVVNLKSNLFKTLPELINTKMELFDGVRITDGSDREKS
jgi:hypothetical protein